MLTNGLTDLCMCIGNSVTLRAKVNTRMHNYTNNQVYTNLALVPFLMIFCSFETLYI